MKLTLIGSKDYRHLENIYEFISYADWVFPELEILTLKTGKVGREIQGSCSKLNVSFKVFSDTIMKPFFLRSAVVTPTPCVSVLVNVPS